MNITKLPSGSYRIRQMYKGKVYSVTVDHKPGKKEATILMADLLNKPLSYEKGQLTEYIDRYISDRNKNGLSPSTIKNYESIHRNLPMTLLQADLFDIDNRFLQRQFDIYAEGRSYKTVRNAYGLVRSVFAEFRPDFKILVKVSDKNRNVVKKAKYNPTTKDIERILEYSSDSRYSIPLQLCVLGLRRGEMVAIDIALDLHENNTLTINKSMVLGSDNKYHVKSTKTADSIRTITLPASLAESIRTQGYIFRGNPHTINEYLHKCQDALEIPRFPLHTLRHFAAAYLIKQGFTAEQVRDWNGWAKGSSVMEKVYLYNLDGDESKPDIAAAFSDIVSKS